MPSRDKEPRLPSPAAGPRLPFTAAERRVIARHRTPAAVQHYLNRLPYNTEPAPGGATLRSFRGVIRTGTAHCMEGAVGGGVILGQHGSPPLIFRFESIDEPDPGLFVYQYRGR